MQLLLGRGNYVLGYATEGSFANGVPVETIPDEVLQNPRAYKYTAGAFIKSIDTPDSPLQEEALTQELFDIKQWFNNTDYMVLKVARNNWSATDPRYVQYLTDYATKHTRMNEIAQLLGTPPQTPDTSWAT